MITFKPLSSALCTLKELSEVLHETLSKVRVVLHPQLPQPPPVQLHVPGPGGAPGPGDLGEVAHVQPKVLADNLTHPPLAQLLHPAPVIHAPGRVLENQISQYPACSQRYHVSWLTLIPAAHLAMSWVCEGHLTS